MMKKGKLKKQIGIFYLVLSLIIILVSLFSFKFLLYVGISFLGLSLRAFYFTYIQKDEELKAEEVRGCYANYYFYYPLMLLTLLSLVYLYLFNQFISPNIDCVPRSSLIALISLYVGFDIYRIAGNRL